MEKKEKIFNWIYSHRYKIILLTILLLAAILRLYRISDYMTFLGDEGRDLIEVKKILSGDLVFLGPRSSAADFYYGPVYFYFITPFLWLFNYDPAGPAVFIALLGILTVYLVYFVGKKFFDIRTGLIAASLYTVSPLVIAYSRSSWNPNPMPFVSLLLLLVTHIAIKSKSEKLFIISGLLLGIAIQLQYLALFLGMVFVFFTVLGIFEEKKIGKVLFLTKSYIFAFIGFIVGWSPFLIFEIRYGFPNLKTIISFLFSGGSIEGGSSRFFIFENIQLTTFKLFGRLLLRFPSHELMNINVNPQIRIWQMFVIVLGIVSLLLLLNSKNKLVKYLLLSWFIVGIGLFGFYKKEIYDYYLGFLFPLPFILTGNAISVMLDFRKPVIPKIPFVKYFIPTLGLLIFIFIFVFNLEGNPFRNIPNKQKDQVKTIAEFIISKTDNKPYNFALLTMGNSDHGYRYYLDILGHPPTIIQYAGVDPERKSVTEQLLVVCEDKDCGPLGDGLWEVAGFGKADIVGEWQVSVVKVFKLKHALK